MTALMFMAPMMSLPKMNPADMLSGMLGVSPIVGLYDWKHFRWVYVYLLNPHVHIHSRAGKGILFGLVVVIMLVLQRIL